MTSENGLIVFLTPEIALDQSLHIYSGGLGVFSGGFLVSAKKLGLPAIGITILPRQGYYDQKANGHGMEIQYINRFYDEILEKTGIKFAIEVCGKCPIWIEVLKLPEGRFNSVEIFFLDTDISENDPYSRTNTLQLYGGSYHSGANLDRKIMQSLIFAKGSIELIRRLGRVVRFYHVNESYGTLVMIELFSNFLANGLSVEEAIKSVRSTTVFTTHTPVDAGNPKYPTEILANFGNYSREMLVQCGGSPFDMAATGFFLSQKSNAVSKRHLTTAQKIWHWTRGAPLISITNGVNRDFWQYGEFRNSKSALETAWVKRIYKKELINLISSRTGHNLNEDILTIVWARRFAEYKRPKLIFYNYDWLISKLISKEIQLIFAGKPHPDDRPMIDVWNEIFGLSQEFESLVMLPGYELELSKILKGGADLWLNTPRAPYEACGTSGMSAAMNGAIHMSTPDGWACEANPENCFLFGSDQHLAGGYSQDAHDAVELKNTLEQALDMHYRSKNKWYEKSFNAKTEAEERWTSDRMVAEYEKLLYC